MSKEIYSNLTPENQILFVEECFKHVFPKVKKHVQQYASDVPGILECINLVSQWFENKDSISVLDVHQAWANADNIAALSEGRLSDISDAAASLVDALYTASVDNYSNIHFLVWLSNAHAFTQIIETGYNSSAWNNAKKSEQEWQINLLNQMVNMQNNLQHMDEENILNNIRAVDMDSIEARLLMNMLKDKSEVASDYLSSHITEMKQIIKEEILRILKWKN